MPAQVIIHDELLYKIKIHTYVLWAVLFRAIFTFSANSYDTGRQHVTRGGHTVNDISRSVTHVNVCNTCSHRLSNCQALNFPHFNSIGPQ